MDSLTKVKISYVGLITAGVIFVALSEADIIPTQYLQTSANEQYILQIICFILAIGGTWLSLRLFAFRNIKRQIKEDQTGKALARYNMGRTILIGTALLTNAVIYYATMDTSSLYCFLITAVGALFCWPKQNEV